MTVIGTNMASLRASNSALKANDMLSTSMERLSTGRRINSSKDDAAGLAIATSMTSQIRGMNQSIRNANDGISLAQTAEGALSEVTNMLQRVRELAVQSSSGTYSDSDRTNMQTEVTQLTAQIDDIMRNTKFNDVQLFASDKDISVKIQTGSNSGQTVDLAITKLDLSAITGKTIAAPVEAVEEPIDGEEPVAEKSLVTVATGDDYIGSEYTVAEGDAAEGVEFAAVVDRVVKLREGDTISDGAGGTTTVDTASGLIGTDHTITQDDLDDGATFAALTAPEAGESYTLVEGDKVFVEAAADTPAETPAATGELVTVATGDEHIGTEYTVAEGDAAEGVEFAAVVDRVVKLREGDTISDGAGGTTTVDTASGLIGTDHTITQDDLDDGATFAALTAPEAGESYTLVEGDKIFVAAEAPAETPGETPGETPAATGLQITSRTTASAALDSIDDALDSVATTRASLGAGQSRLQSVVNNLTTNMTNLSEARSRIEDTDFATETAELAKAQILSQASTAMLAQANQSQQSVLSLLR
ncbi:hypothetical protein FBR43_15570 [Sphingomonas baiyangensis]|uniref:Flagellin n=1 Tax=Sphingomonas baiyangensis TaxID=2572576 RepID=A0A4V5PU47_9SPHN|nr:hypothetical protein FBR43_15570 [Sphingomonas baiyangensis]